jgi:hypothetical protein
MPVVFLNHEVMAGLIWEKAEVCDENHRQDGQKSVHV